MKEIVFPKTKSTLFSAFSLMSISIFILFCPSVSSADCTWTGAWNITQRIPGIEDQSFTLTLNQNGSQVTGFSDYEGTVSGETVSFPVACFVKSNGVCTASGYIFWTMQPDCNHFTGSCEWDLDKPECSLTWTGVRVDVPNQPPEVTLSYFPIQPFVGKLMTFTADAFDPDGDALEYTWYLDGAEQAGTSEFQWSNPTVGYHIVSVLVSDKKGGDKEDFVEFNVIEPKRYVIAPGMQDGSGEAWGFVDKIFIDGKEVSGVENTVLYSASQIKTGPGVEILVRSSGGAVTRITEDTQYEVKTTQYATPTTQAVYGRLLKGVIDFYWPPGHEAEKKFEVETNRVTVGIKGTTFSVSHFLDVTTVEVEEGVVEVKNIETNTLSILQAGDRISIGDDKAEYYRDKDGDGFGDAADFIEEDYQPAGYVTNSTDCDDSDMSVYPGAIEICGDGIDQDCDGSDLSCAPDPNDIDDDGDGYTENQGDCNDKNKNIHPGAIEICGDGVDQDCDGAIDEDCGAAWAGNYTVQIQSTLTVKKVGKYADTTGGQLTLEENGTFDLDDYSTSHDMSGTFVLDAKGKKILYTPSADGLAALEDSLIEWLEANGLYDLDFNFVKIKTSKVKIDKKTGRAAGNIKLDVSGTVSGCKAGHDCMTTKFKYRAMILLTN